MRTIVSEVRKTSSQASGSIGYGFTHVGVRSSDEILDRSVGRVEGVWRHGEVVHQRVVPPRRRALLWPWAGEAPRARRPGGTPWRVCIRRSRDGVRPREQGAPASSKTYRGVGHRTPCAPVPTRRPHALVRRPWRRDRGVAQAGPSRRDWSARASCRARYPARSVDGSIAGSASRPR